MTSTALGFHGSHEQHPPETPPGPHAQLAAEAGFEEAMCSHHFHPWSERQTRPGYT